MTSAVGGKVSGRFENKQVAGREDITVLYLERPDALLGHLDIMIGLGKKRILVECGVAGNIHPNILQETATLAARSGIQVQWSSLSAPTRRNLTDESTLLTTCVVHDNEGDGLANFDRATPAMDEQWTTP